MDGGEPRDAGELADTGELADAGESASEIGLDEGEEV